MGEDPQQHRPAPDGSPCEPRSAMVLVLGVVVTVALCLWSARAALDLPVPLWGRGIDAYKEIWILWWAGESLLEGPLTTLVSFPTGSYGATLTPIGVYLVLPVALTLGYPLAYDLLALFYLLLAASGAGLVARRLSGSNTAAAVAAVATVAPRALAVQVGYGNVEGVAIGWLLLASYLGLRWVDPRGDGRGGAWVGLLFFCAVIDNPYMVLVAPPLALGFGLARLRRAGWPKQLVLATLAGATPLLLRLFYFGRGMGRTQGITLHRSVFGLDLSFADAPVFSAKGLVWPFPGVNFEMGEKLVHETGNTTYLGWTVLLLVLVGITRGRRGWLVGVLSLCVLVLGAGSLPFGMEGPPGPFAFVSTVLMRFGTALSNPLRLLSLATGGLAITAGLGAAWIVTSWPRLARWVGPGLVLLVGLDGLFLGVGAVRIPAGTVPHFSCLASLDHGAVLTLFADSGVGYRARSEENVQEVSVYLLQMSHELPCYHAGFTNWATAPRSLVLDGLVPELERSLEMADRELFAQTREHAQEHGFTWVVLPEERPIEWLPGAPRCCGGWCAYPL